MDNFEFTPREWKVRPSTIAAAWPRYFKATERFDNVDLMAKPFKLEDFLATGEGTERCYATGRHGLHTRGTTSETW